MSYWVFPRAKLSRKKQQCKYVPKTQCSMLSHWKICICTACLNRLLINKVKKQKHTLCQVFNHSRLMPWFMNRCSPELCNPEFSLNLWEPGQYNWDCDLSYLLKEFNYCPFLPFCWTRGWSARLQTISMQTKLEWQQRTPSPQDLPQYLILLPPCHITWCLKLKSINHTKTVCQRCYHRDLNSV